MAAGEPLVISPIARTDEQPSPILGRYDNDDTYDEDVSYVGSTGQRSASSRV
jgi:hypothetical protein